MDTYSLKLFMHLARSLHFTRTSGACNISPSGLTRAIQRLEDEVGAPLFIRDNRKVSLTREGELLKNYGARILETWEGFYKVMAEGQGIVRGELEIYCSVTASYSVLREILPPFREAYPQVHIHLQTGEAAVAIQRVLDGEAAVSIAVKPDKLPEILSFKEVSTVPLTFIAPRNSCAVRDLLKAGSPWHELPLILPLHGAGRRSLNAWFKENSLNPNIYAEIRGNEAITAMVGLGCGIGLVPRLVLEESAHAREIKILPRTPELPPYRIGFCVKTSRLSTPAVNAFWEMINS